MLRLWKPFKEGIVKLWSVAIKPALAGSALLATLLPVIVLIYYTIDTFQKVKKLENETAALADQIQITNEKTSKLEGDLAASDRCREEAFNLAEAFGQHIKALEKRTSPASRSQEAKDRWFLFEVGAKVFIARCQCYGGYVHFAKLRCEGELTRNPSSFDREYEPE